MNRGRRRACGMVFTDAYERTIDAKKRIQIPAEYRGVLARESGDEAFYMCPGERRNTLALYPESTFRQRAEQLRTEEISSDDALAFEQLYYSVASRLEILLIRSLTRAYSSA